MSLEPVNVGERLVSAKCIPICPPSKWGGGAKESKG